MDVLPYKLLDDGHKGLGFGVFDLHGDSSAVTLYHAEDGGLGLCGTALSALGFLALMLVGLTSAKVHFVHFHVTIEGDGIVLGEQCADFVQHVPSGLLSYLAVP